MRTALDTNILSQLWSAQPSAAAIAAKLSHARAEGALVVSAPVFVELAAIPTPKLQGAQRVGMALGEMNISIDFDLGENVWQLAARTFSAYAIRRRHSGGGSPKRLLADFVIAAHAMLMADRFMTRDVNLYAQDFPNLRLI
jgi:predicted nucleic acid-binding protein